MATFGPPKVESILPDDVEGVVRTLQNKITNLRKEAEHAEIALADKKLNYDSETAKMLLEIETLEKKEEALNKSIKEKQNQAKLYEESIVNQEQELGAIKLERSSSEKELLYYQNELSSLRAGLQEKEKFINEKESALNVYANALGEKEAKIKRYLSIFDKMKDIVTNDTK